MIDVSQKEVTQRVALAEGTITMAEASIACIQAKRVPKGDVLAAAKIAGMIAAKKTPELLPYCHPLVLDKVQVDCEIISKQTIKITCEVVCFAKTGVEMEALAGVWGALLCIYDMVKGLDAALVINDVFLRTKKGGKQGLWQHPRLDKDVSVKAGDGKPLQGLRVGVLTVSDSCYRHQSEDKSGPALREALTQAGGEVIQSTVVPDDKETIAKLVSTWIKEQSLAAVFTTGGTGLGPRDVTPEALRPLFDREVPGFGELLRSSGAAYTKRSWLSRSCAGLIGETLVVLLPGSVKAVAEGFAAVIDLLPHAVDIARGSKH
jgi:cyclic pyranopterin phosphate synthase